MSIEPTRIVSAADATCDAPDFIGEGLYCLSERLGSLRPEEQAHGALGGAWGYGQDYSNSTFEMFPYYWGDCTCGFEHRQDEWDAANGHAADCYQAALARLHAKRQKASGERATRASDRVYELARDALCDRFGLSRDVCCEVHCTCSHDDDMMAWRAENDHDPRCPSARPNFFHRKSGLAVYWYKWIGRGMTCNLEVTPSDWFAIVADCMASIDGMVVTACEFAALAMEAVR